MAITITVNENSYIDLTGADSYFETRLNADAWDNASEEEKKKALITATNRIDYYNFIGVKYDADQPLEFPRRYFHQIEPFYRYDQELQDGETPQEVKDATCEEAIELLDLNTALEKKQKQGITSESIGDTSRSYSEDAVKRKLQGRKLTSPEAKSLLQQYIKSTTKLG